MLYPFFTPKIQAGGMVCALMLALMAGAPVSATGQSTTTNSRYDLTHNAVVDGADAAVMTSAWNDTQSAPCVIAGNDASDFTRDGCIDVTDVQQLTSTIGFSFPATRATLQDGELFAWKVTSAADEPDAAIGDGVCRVVGGKCTLRAAIAEANVSNGPDLISFDIRNNDTSCPALVNIYPDAEANGMLTLDDPRGYGTTIDGYTQCGASPNTDLVKGNAVVKIELRGRLNRDIHGLRVLSANNVVRGLAMFNWDRQIEIYGGRAKYNRVEGNFLGTNGAQTFRSLGLGTHHSEGLRMQIGASYNIIGCGSFDAANQFIACADPKAVAAARNIVIGNGNDGIHLEREAFYNRIVGNFVGVKQDGVTAWKNNSDGVDIEAGPQYNWLGGLTPFERNVISGNGSEGLEVSHNTKTKFNTIAGNYFGLDSTGTIAVPNNGNGVSFEDTVDQNYAYNNVVSGNNQGGFRFYVLATNNIVRNNVVGLAADGVTPMPNRHNGVYVMGGSSSNLISENTIAYNREYAVFLASTSDSDNNGVGKTYYNTISKNRMYQNGLEGIKIYGKRNIFPNENLPEPVLVRANTVRVEGTACFGCKIEVFRADKTALGGTDDHGEGMEFVGEGMADGAGNFRFDVPEIAVGSILTASATDVKGNTSMFSKNIAVTQVEIGSPTPAPTLTPTPTLTPSPTLSPTPTDPANPPTATTQPTAQPTTPTPTSQPGNAPQYRNWLPITQQ